MFLNRNSVKVMAAALALGLSGAMATQAQAVVAYVLPAGTDGNQGFGGALGMDFNVNQAISIDTLGVFDDDSDGLATPIVARIYNRAATFTSSPVATIVFPAGTPGTVIDGSRFLELPFELQLPAGFQGTIVASGYNAAEENGNAGGGPLGLTTDSGGGQISFVGGSRFGVDPNLFPATSDGGPAQRYAAGTFNFSASTATPVALQNGTAIHSQGGFSVDFAIDNNATPNVGGTGWANSALGDNTAVFETVSDIFNENGTKLQITMVSGGFSFHTLGRFRLSVTGDDRSTFADGLDNAGDVTANWTVLDIDSIMSGNPNTIFTELGDLSILASGVSDDVETYTLIANAHIQTITGIRLEMIEDPSLLSNGPGRSGNGNYVLLEFSVLAETIIVPEPASAMLLILGGAGLIARRRRIA